MGPKPPNGIIFIKEILIHALFEKIYCLWWNCGDCFLIKYNIPGAEYEQIGSFRGASLEAETWNPLIASSVNDNLLSVIIDNKQYTNEKYKFYMDDNLDIMMPVSICGMP